MDASPSIRSSYKPGQSVQYIRTKPAAHEALKKLVGDCLEGLRIYQPFQGDKVLVPLAKGTFFARIHTNPVETGFLVFSPRHTPVFIHESLRWSNVIRMRLSTYMHSNTAIFTACLDKSDGFLWLEDILAWEGKPIHRDQPFTQRRSLLKKFLEHHWMPDARATGGLHIRVANYVSLESLKNYTDQTAWWCIDLCPELQDRRRIRLRAAGGNYSSLVAEIRAVTGLPDVYELWSAENQCVGRAAIQELALSKIIREKVLVEKLYVEVEWNASFEKFRVVKLVSNATARTPTDRFLKISVKKPVENENDLQQSE